MSRALDPTKVAAARLWAVTRYPYLSSAVLATEIVDRPGIGTIATDARWRLYIDADLAHRFSTPDLGRLVVHHVGHLLREHGARADERGVGDALAQMWVRACDAEINDDMPSEDRLAIHERSLPQSFGAAPGQFAEQYFEHLQARHGPRWKPFNRDSQLDCGSGADGKPRAWEDAEGGIDEAAARLIRLKVAAATREHASSDPDSVASGVLRWADRVVGISVDWRRLLAAEIRRGTSSAPGSTDYTYRRPSRRRASTPDVVLPSLHHPVPTIAVVCDTSASMEQKLLDEALTHVDTILRSLTDRRTPLPVIACDTEVRALSRVSRASQVELSGGGATDLSAGIAAAAGLKPRPSTIIVLTDGGTAWPSRPPPRSRVVVGLLGRPPDDMPPPRWAKVIGIRSVGSGIAAASSTLSSAKASK